jgi:signal transduction histidine kinase
LKDLNLKVVERDILERINKKIFDENSFEDIFDMFFDNINQILPCERLDIFIKEENGARVEISRVRVNYSNILMAEGYTIDVPGTVFEQILALKAPYIINLIEDRVKFENNKMLDLLVGEGMRWCSIVPVVTAGNVLGFLSCCTSQANVYSERQAELFEEVARLLRYPMERVFQRTQIDLNYKAYMEMLAFVAHELKSPISSIITLTQTLAEGYYGKIGEKQQEILRRIIKKGEYLHEMSSQYINLSRFESNIMEMEIKLVDFVDDIIEPIIDILLPQIDERAIKLERDYQDVVFPVRCDPDLIKIVVMNLLSNGIKYGNKGGILRLTIEKKYKKFKLTVWNEGPGFSEQEKHRLFKKFSRLLATELIERKGSGIGLYVTWKIIQLHCGRIYAESEQGSWARFIIEIPQYQDLCIIE